MAKNQMTSYPRLISARGRGERMRAPDFRTRCASWEEEEKMGWLLDVRREREEHSPGVWEIRIGIPHSPEGPSPTPQNSSITGKLWGASPQGEPFMGGPSWAEGRGQGGSPGHWLKEQPRRGTRASAHLQEIAPECRSHSLCAFGLVMWGRCDSETAYLLLGPSTECLLLRRIWAFCSRQWDVERMEILIHLNQSKDIVFYLTQWLLLLFELEAKSDFCCCFMVMTFMRTNLCIPSVCVSESAFVTFISCLEVRFFCVHCNCSLLTWKWWRQSLALCVHKARPGIRFIGRRKALGFLLQVFQSVFKARSRRYFHRRSCPCNYLCHSMQSALTDALEWSVLCSK